MMISKFELKISTSNVRMSNIANAVATHLQIAIILNDYKRLAESYNYMFDVREQLERSIKTNEGEIDQFCLTASTWVAVSIEKLAICRRLSRQADLYLDLATEDTSIPEYNIV